VEGEGKEFRVETMEEVTLEEKAVGVSGGGDKDQGRAVL
jgi:hypothetical protein